MEIWKTAFLSVVKPGIPGKSQKTKAGVCPKSKEDSTIWISKLGTSLNFQKYKQR